MSKKFIAPVLLSVLAVFLFSVGSAQANSSGSTLARTTLARVSSVPAASIMAASLLQTPTTSSAAAANKKKTVAPEPATWLYVLGAVLVVLVIERKALKARFSSSPTN